MPQLVVELPGLHPAGHVAAQVQDVPPDRGEDGAHDPDRGVHHRAHDHGGLQREGHPQPPGLPCTNAATSISPDSTATTVNPALETPPPNCHTTGSASKKTMNSRTRVPAITPRSPFHGSRTPGGGTGRPVSSFGNSFSLMPAPCRTGHGLPQRSRQNR